ncbi:MAG: glycoside hydrolase family 2 TIM barrel-domain containing protein, partial [Bacteroidales bacterium]|nr:glycoside hydrolase family 2 TIM barrel-domain containing protein [Bacteroidales bacterium]
AVNSDDFNILHSEKRAVFRKAAFQFGWDWAPRQLAGEISLPVRLTFEDEKEYLRFASVQTEKISDNSANMLLTLKTEFLENKPYNIKVSYSTEGEKTITKNLGEFYLANSEENISKLQFEIANPKLWYPNGYGKPTLYDAVVYISDEQSKVLDSVKTRFGIRTIELSQEKDKYGSEFCFIVNGKKIFAKGSNLVPTAMHKERYEGMAKHIDLVRECNMNMLRVWGGGYYVDEKMYEACDEKGILIWQDFPFACALYPASEEYLAEVETEAKENVLRISSHPSLTLWCGNNEIWEGWGNWSWDKEVKDTALAVENYNKLFKQLLPNIVNEYCPTTDYTHSSPLNGWGRKESLTEGDCHYWGVWWGDSTFETYTRKVPRFMSEYGFQSAPNMKTVKKYYTLPYTKENPGFAIHQKHNRGFELIENRILERYEGYKPNEDYIEKTYLVASDAFSIGIEAHLRAMPYCMGSLTWQLNEPYPAIGWSCIDVDYLKKDVYHTIQQSFAPIVVSVDKYSSSDSVFVYIINSSWEDEKVNLRIKIIDYKNNESYSSSLKNYSIAQMSSNIVFSIAKKDIKEFSPQTHKITIEGNYLDKDKNNVIINKTVYFDYPKNLKCE